MRRSLKEQLEALQNMKDEDIDTSDIPEVTDFSGFVRRAAQRTLIRGDTDETRGPTNT